MAISYDAAAVLLQEAFEEAEILSQKNKIKHVSKIASEAVKILMASKTQAFREAVIGCCLVRVLDDAIDIRKPYIGQGTDAFNGRTLDERVVNPLLQEKEVPCSKGPYLSALRRNISFVPETEKGLRDKEAFGAMLAFIAELQAGDSTNAHNMLLHLMSQFVTLREKSKIILSQINRLSIEQHATLLNLLLSTASGGLLPVLLAVSTFNALKAVYGLPWLVDWQGINVADAASGAGGDVTIRRGTTIILSVEITERIIDEDRVRSTFRTKISPNAIDDYLFFFSTSPPTEGARTRAKTYFAQGHEINFAPVKEWIITVLSTLGANGRTIFTKNIVALLDRNEVPASIKVAWNEHVRSVLA